MRVNNVGFLYRQEVYHYKDKVRMILTLSLNIDNGVRTKKKSNQIFTAITVTLE